MSLLSSNKCQQQLNLHHLHHKILHKMLFNSVHLQSWQLYNYDKMFFNIYFRMNLKQLIIYSNPPRSSRRSRIRQDLISASNIGLYINTKKEPIQIRLEMYRAIFIPYVKPNFSYSEVQLKIRSIKYFQLGIVKMGSNIAGLKMRYPHDNCYTSNRMSNNTTS